MGGQCLLLSNEVKDTIITTTIATTTTTTTSTTITTATTTKCVSTRWVKCPRDQKPTRWWRKKGRRKRDLKEKDYFGDKLDHRLFDAYSELDGFGGSEFDKKSRIEYWGARAPSAQPR